MMDFPELPDFLRLTEEQRRAGRRLIPATHKQPKTSRHDFDRPKTWTPEAARIAQEVAYGRTAEGKRREAERQELIAKLRKSGLTYQQAVARVAILMKGH